MVDKAHFLSQRAYAIKMARSAPRKWIRTITLKYYWAGSYMTKTEGEAALKAAQGFGFDARLFTAKLTGSGAGKTYYWLGITKED